MMIGRRCFYSDARCVHSIPFFSLFCLTVFCLLLLLFKSHFLWPLLCVRFSHKIPERCFIPPPFVPVLTQTAHLMQHRKTTRQSSAFKRNLLELFYKTIYSIAKCLSIKCIFLLLLLQQLAEDRKQNKLIGDNGKVLCTRHRHGARMTNKMYSNNKYWFVWMIRDRNRDKRCNNLSSSIYSMAFK